MATELNQARAQVERTLKLCDSETADALIGSPQPDEYGTLVRGVRAAYMMLWMLANGSTGDDDPVDHRPLCLRAGDQAR